MREADADGLPGFLETRALPYPESLAAADLARLETHQASRHRGPHGPGPPQELTVGRGRRDARSGHRPPRGDRLPRLQTFPFWLPRGILGLEAAGKAEEARALHERLWEWLSGTGNGTSSSAGGEAQWMVAHEVGLLDPGFPPASGERRRSRLSPANGKPRSKQRDVSWHSIPGSPSGLLPGCSPASRSFATSISRSSGARNRSRWPAPGPGFPHPFGSARDGRSPWARPPGLVPFRLRHFDD